MSAGRPGPETVPTNANGDARSGGPSVGSPQINSACVPETTSHDLRGRVQGIHPLHGSPLPWLSLNADNRHYVNLSVAQYPYPAAHPIVRTKLGSGASIQNWRDS